MFNYNTFHKKNKKVQIKPINDHDYTYQSLIKLTGKYFLSKGMVLDFGCGVGTIDFYLESKGFFVTGVDVSNRAIDLANQSKDRMQVKNANFICSSVELFKSGVKFDYAICSEVIEHVAEPQYVLKKIYSLLKKNGLCIISVPSLNAPLYRWGFLNRFDREVGHLRRYDNESLTRTLTDSGFEVVERIKAEGLIRNLLYTNKFLGELIRVVRFPLTILVNFLDNLLMTIFGESNLYFIVKKR